MEYELINQFGISIGNIKMMQSNNEFSPQKGNFTFGPMYHFSKIYKKVHTQL